MCLGICLGHLVSFTLKLFYPLGEAAPASFFSSSLRVSSFMMTSSFVSSSQISLIFRGIIIFALLQAFAQIAILKDAQSIYTLHFVSLSGQF
jgi:hypothetical protein